MAGLVKDDYDDEESTKLGLNSFLNPQMFKSALKICGKINITMTCEDTSNDFCENGFKEFGQSLVFRNSLAWVYSSVGTSNFPQGKCYFKGYP